MKDFIWRWLIHRAGFPRWFLSDYISICVCFIKYLALSKLVFYVSSSWFTVSVLSTRYGKVIISLSAAIIFSFEEKHITCIFIQRERERFVGEILTLLTCRMVSFRSYNFSKMSWMTWFFWRPVKVPSTWTSLKSGGIPAVQVDWLCRNKLGVCFEFCKSEKNQFSFMVS